MKTLREYIDQLDEISRRDALKYAGATAAGAALGGAAGFYKGAGGQVDKNIAYDLGFLWGFTAAANETLRTDNYPGFYRVLVDMKKSVDELFKMVDSDIQKHPWYSYGFDSGLRYFHSKGPWGPRSPDDVKKLTKTFDQLLDRARQSSYGQAQKIFKEQELEESEPLDPIQKIDRLFRDK